MILLATLLSFGWPTPVIEFGPERALRDGESSIRLNACCGSMAPVIRGGETAYVVPYHGQSLVGRIVDNGIATHMVIAESKNSIKTSGVNNRHSDAWFPKRNIVRVITYIVRP